MSYEKDLSGLGAAPPANGLLKTESWILRVVLCIIPTVSEMDGKVNIHNAQKEMLKIVKFVHT